ncbi:MAG: RNA-binding protein [Peptococcales bacterium]|jgi:large subunit ribosomal protein L14e
MSTREIKKGQLVKSRAGRDQDKFYLVFSWDHEYVYVVDGNTRRIQNPKKKNIRHLWYTDKVASVINNKLETGQKVTNADIREALRDLDVKVDFE